MSSDQKLISALHKLAQENFSVTDDTILEKLYYHIVNSPNFNEKKSTFLPQLSDWLEVIIKGWNNKVLLYGVQVFSFRFIGNIGSDVIGFKILQDQNVLHFLENLISSSDVQNDGCLMVSLINTFEMFLKHDEGWNWITESKIWRLVMNLSYENGQIYTKRAIIKFISQILITSTNYVTIVGNEIMNFICKPLTSNHLLKLGTYDEYTTKPFAGVYSQPANDDVKEIKEPKPAELLYAAKYLCDILENILGNNTKLPVRLYLVNKLNSDLRSESVIVQDILANCSSSQDHITFSSLLLMVEVNKSLSQNTLSCTSMGCCLNQLYYQVHCIFKSLTSVGHFRAIPSFCVTCLYWLSKIKQKKTDMEKGCKVCEKMESTIVYPLRLFIISHDLTLIRNLNLEFKDFTIGLQLSKKIDEARLTCYKNKKTTFQFFHLALSAITRSYDLIVYHGNFVALLKSIMRTFHSLVRHFLLNEDLTKPYILQFLDITSKMSQKNHLTSDEITGLFLESHPSMIYSIFRFLDYETNDIRVTIFALQALTKFVKFYILTEVDDQDDEYLVNGGFIPVEFKNSILTKQLKCEHWEVRDTAIEVFQSAIEINEWMPWICKVFTPAVLQLIFEKASDDESAYVKASALNFFSKAVRCKLFANVILPNSLLNLAMKTLIEDNMPVARKSACDLIAALYISYVPAVLSDIEQIFDTVFLASTKDLDWEVKKSTLKFWQCTIEKDLLVEMVAFNTDLHPHLNTPARQEAVLRIIRVMETLGESGCLKAIWLSLNDDCDLKVSQEAQSIVESLEKLNERWGFLDDILKCQEGGEEKYSIESSNRRLTPKTFFSLLLNENWREKIDSHRQWIENTCDNLPSLLDLILDDNRVDDGDLNAVDCY